MTDLCTEDLRAKLLPVNAKLKEVDRDRRERRKIRKKTRTALPAAPSTETTAPAPAATSEDTTMATDPRPASEAGQAAGDPLTGLEDESVYQAKEREAIEKLVDQSLKADLGANVSGLYDLCGRFTLALPDDRDHI